MKKYYCLYFLLNLSIGFTQDPTHFLPDLFKLYDNPNHSITPEGGQQFSNLHKKYRAAIDSILKDEQQFPCQENEILNQQFENFHLQDIDLDGDQDLIYVGRPCPGIESIFTQIYLKRNGTFEYIAGNWGSIYSITAKEIIIQTNPCCASTEEIFHIYSIQKDTLNKEYAINVYPFLPSPQYRLLTTLSYQGQITPTQLSIYYLPEFFEDKYYGSNIGKLLTNKPIPSYGNFTDEHGVKWTAVLVHHTEIQLKDEQNEIDYYLVWISNK